MKFIHTITKENQGEFVVSTQNSVGKTNFQLNYKRTFLVGLAFFLICLFWGVYDAIVALTLTNKFGLSQTWSGLILALDNIFALFMLPIFGSLSDKAKGPLARRWGKRTPFVLIGTIVAVICFIGMFAVDTAQIAVLEDLQDQNTVAQTLWQSDTVVDNPFYEDEDNALSTIINWFDTNTAQKVPDGFSTTIKRGTIRELFDETEGQVDFATLTPEDGALFTDIVVPMRNAMAKELTTQNSTCLIWFVIMLLLALISMATFRSPAVALMPAVTIKPLRSKANAVINIMGTLGGAMVLAFGMVFGTSSPYNALMSYLPYVFVVSGIMLIALFIFKFTINEPKLVQEMEDLSQKYGLDQDEQEEQRTAQENRGKKMSKEKLASLLLLMASIFFWFFGYNAITSKFSVYATNVLQTNFNLALIVAQISALIAFLPAGMLASKIGRKKTILAGIVLLAVCFFSGNFVTANSGWIMFLLFALAGVAWASINCNSLPMVVELATGADVGKYTGWYYFASMSAQSITPIFSGFLMDQLGMKGVLFPYGAIFVALSFVTMLFVKHGDNKAEIPESVLEALGDAD